MKISVIVPTYNRRDKVAKALFSIYAQSFSPLEVIVIDDGSEDDTGKMILSEYPQVIYKKIVNSGVSKARNEGIAVAKGDWVAFLDSDDTWHPQKLKAQVDYLENNKKAQFLHTEETWVRNGVKVNQKKKHQKVRGLIFKQCLGFCIIGPSTVIVEKNLLEKVGGFDENLEVCEDYDLWLRLSLITELHFLSTPLIYKHGGHEDQLSTRYWGMDRYRVKSLLKILRREELGENNKKALLQVLEEKISLLIKGSLKHGKMKEVEKYRGILKEVFS